MNIVGKAIAITQRAMIVASYIADSVDTASKVNPWLHLLHIIQLARQMSANEEQHTNRAIAAIPLAFISKVRSILGS